MDRDGTYIINNGGEKGRIKRREGVEDCFYIKKIPEIFKRTLQVYHVLVFFPYSLDDYSKYNIFLNITVSDLYASYDLVQDVFFAMLRH